MRNGGPVDRFAGTARREAASMATAMEVGDLGAMDAAVRDHERAKTRSYDLYVARSVVEHPMFGQFSERGQKFAKDTLDWLLSDEKRIWSAKIRGVMARSFGALQRMARGEAVVPGGIKGRNTYAPTRVIKAMAALAHQREVTAAASPWTRDPSLLPKAPPGRSR